MFARDLDEELADASTVRSKRCFDRIVERVSCEHVDLCALRSFKAGSGPLGGGHVDDAPEGCHSKRNRPPSPTHLSDEDPHVTFAIHTRTFIVAIAKIEAVGGKGVLKDAPENLGREFVDGSPFVHLAPQHCAAKGHLIFNILDLVVKHDQHPKFVTLPYSLPFQACRIHRIGATINKVINGEMNPDARLTQPHLAPCARTATDFERVHKAQIFPGKKPC